jgi:hypothetical protein
MDPRLVLIVAGLAGAAALQGPLGEANARRRENDFRYTPDARIVKLVAGGDRSVVADAMWLQAMPDFARPFSDRKLKKRWLAGVTDVVVDLEPSFGTVYRYGAAYLTLVDKDADAAVRLLEKGVANNPDSAGMLVELAMVHHMFRHDRVKTMEALEKAATKPDIDNLSLAMLAAMKVDERDDLVAIGYWAKTYDEAPNAKVRAIAEHDLWFTKKHIADRALRDFEKEHKRKATSVEEIRDPKLMDPKVFDLVFDGLELDANGRATYAKLADLERALRIVQTENYVASFLEGEGRLPTEKEFFDNFGALPPPPTGKKWRFADGKLSLVDG